MASVVSKNAVTRSPATWTDASRHFLTGSATCTVRPWSTPRGVASSIRHHTITSTDP